MHSTPDVRHADNKICLKTIDSNEFKWFQLKFLNRIFGAREYLVKLCKRFFTRCNSLQKFWKKL